MSPKQTKVYKHILDYQKKRGFVPSTIEIGKRFAHSPQYIQQIIDVLIKKGYLKKKKPEPRGQYEVIHSPETTSV